MSSLQSHWAATAMGVYWGLEEPILTSISIHRHHHFHHHHHNFEKKINITINYDQLNWDLAASAHLLAWKKNGVSDETFIENNSKIHCLKQNNSNSISILFCLCLKTFIFEFRKSVKLSFNVFQCSTSMSNLLIGDEGSRETDQG